MWEHLYTSKPYFKLNILYKICLVDSALGLFLALQFLICLEDSALWLFEAFNIFGLMINFSALHFFFFGFLDWA